MNPETHLLASWVIGAKTTDNPRDCRLVALAGIFPDADGLGILVDAVNWSLGRKSFLYQDYHHYWFHGILGAFLVAVLAGCFARRKVRVVLLALVVFHLHLLCDLVGARGPDPGDIWPIFYWSPFTTRHMLMWKHQWPLDAWPNRLLTVWLFVWALWLAVPLGYSFVGVFSPRLDRTFVQVLRKWHGDLKGWWAQRRPPSLDAG